MIAAIPNSDYFVANISNSAYLVRKSDGVAFAFNTQGVGSRYVQDASKNIYFCDGLGRISKLDVSNPANITTTVITSDAAVDIDYFPVLVNFTVSAKGDILYRTNNDIYRVAKSNGGFYNLPTNPYGFTRSIWTGLNGKLKYDGGIGAEDIVFTVNIETNGNVSIEETRVNIPIGGSQMFSSSYRELRLSNRIIRLPLGGILYGGYDYIQEIENPSNNPRYITLSYDIYTVKGGVNSENYYYINGFNTSQQPFLIKVNPVNDAVTELLNAGDYEIYAMSVNNNDELFFSALRMSDGVPVIGKVSSTGNLQIIDTQLNSAVTVLECIQ